MAFEMKLRKAPFELIKNGEKTVEIRLYDEKRRQICIGDRIIFTLDGISEEKTQTDFCTNEASTENLSVVTEVVGLHKSDTFAELFGKMSAEKFGCKGMTVDEMVEMIREYYTEEKEEKYGVLGIEIRMI